MIDPDAPFLAWEEVGAWTKADPATWPLYHVIYHLLEYIRARETLEIGIGRAFGTFMFGLYAKLHGGHHTCIDVAWTPVKRALQIRNKWDFPIDVLHHDSKATVWQKRLDLLFIDGGHRREQVEGDIDRFVPWVRRNGLIFFHCYHNQRWQVREAVDGRFDPDKYEMTIWPYNSLGVAIWRVR